MQYVILLFAFGFVSCCILLVFAGICTPIGWRVAIVIIFLALTGKIALAFTAAGYWWVPLGSYLAACAAWAEFEKILLLEKMRK